VPLSRGGTWSSGGYLYGTGGLMVTRPLRPQTAVGQHFSVGRSVLDRQEIADVAALRCRGCGPKRPFFLAFTYVASRLKVAAINC
jgi:hypothetical protein